MEMNYLDLIENYREDMIKTLQELIAIRSVASEPDGDAPFGRGIQDSFEYMLKKAKEEGFDTENIDNYGGHIEFGGYLLNEEGEVIETNEEIMGILGHLDVVPEGKDWDYEPYGGQLVEDRIYGRGAIDNKGPTVAVFYAMKALKDARVVPQKKVRLILGLDEETGWRGMDYYLKHTKLPDFGFAPDGDFPAIHGEMGILIFDLAKKINKSPANTKGVVLRNMTGGNAANMVADHARAVINADSYDDIKAKLAEFRKATGYQIISKGFGKSLEITAQGISSHGARPEAGLNAISILMKFLGGLNFENEDVNEFINFYNEHIGFELSGDSLGCGLEDKPSGKLILNVGMGKIDEGSASLTINIRYPVTINEEQVYDSILPVINKFNLGIVKKNHHDPIYMPKDDKMICTLMDVYKKHTGDMDCEPKVIGGGTYARAVKNAVAFGAKFPGEPELAHQKNEYITVTSLIKSAKIFADAIFELAGGQVRKA
ncbi:MAG: dipeptidase PepV [Eubacteriales bacterium]|nr:dipeptidase PepV [Eubacteriales bacterium]MDD3199659.1 dipeptidase PepV [Eubacteriales bacterium]MDD4121358.1 dipeptidase PepV [Eubacteriales bacterium]MDD4629800.1 dipeptidase PepV [Eubacteriales bacterium]